MEQRAEQAPMTLWREYSGHVAVPTLVLGLAGPAVFATLLVAGAMGVLPWWGLAPVQTALAYGMFIAMHDATHGSIGGGRRFAWLDTLVGLLVGTVFCSSYAFFRWLHLQHHAHVNHTSKDPDRWVAGGSLALVIVRCFAVIPGYYLHMFRADRSSESARKAQRNTVLGLIPVVACLAAYGVWAGVDALLLLWVVPVLLASALLGYVFDYLPHHPHRQTDRFGNARFAPGRWREMSSVYLVTLGQTHHPMHHLFPRVPWYRYRALYLRVHADLAGRGVPGAARDVVVAERHIVHGRP